MEVKLSVIVLAVIVVVVASAPTLPEGPNAMEQDKNRLLQDFYRDRRSQYPQYLQYGTPCAAAAAAASHPIPAIAPAAYQVNLSPYHPYAPAPAPHSYYGAPHYRSFELEPEQEMLSYSDMDHMMSEHMPMARYGYAVPASSHPAVYAPPPPAGTAPAYGVFPNAKTGGCSVPLLFRCTPSIVPGHVVENQPQGYGNAYRGVEALSHHEPKENHEEPTVQDHLTPVHEASHSTQTVVHQ